MAAAVLRLWTGWEPGARPAAAGRRRPAERDILAESAHGRQWRERRPAAVAGGGHDRPAEDRWTPPSPAMPHPDDSCRLVRCVLVPDGQGEWFIRPRPVSGEIVLD